MTDQQQARALLARLAEDDAFRHRVETDPVAAFAEYGMKVDPASLPEGGVRLPDKQTLIRQMDALGAEMTTAMAVVFFKV